MKKCLLSLLLLLFILPVFCQFKSLEEKILKRDSLNLFSPREKIFIHHDKPAYHLNDTLWFRGYLLTSDEHLPSDSSGLAYVEIIDAAGNLVKRISNPCYAGSFYNNITLTDAEFKQGDYLLRAYTNWMRNFGDSLFYQSHFRIIDPSAGEWKINIRNLRYQQQRLLFYAGLTSAAKKPLASKRVTVKVYEKKKTIFRRQMITDYGGNLFLDTLLATSGTHQQLQLSIESSENISLKFPLTEASKQLIDVQFLPEGGMFIAGRQQRLGIKALNTYGKGTAIKGIIKDSKGQNVTDFATVFKGMGIVSFVPAEGESYVAVLDNGLSFKLPSVQSSGTSLQVMNDADSLKMKVDATADLHGLAYYFTASVKGITVAKGRIKTTAQPYTLSLHKKLFPSGITVFTLYNAAMEPVNERAVFIWQEDQLKLTITPHQDIYRTKDSVMLRLKAMNHNNENIIGSFSMAVIDTSQVKITPGGENLLSYMVLSADIKGDVEDPYYYFTHSSSPATDALMLTQGWVSYQRDTSTPLFSYEKEFLIQGKVTNTFNKPVANSNITLFGKEGTGAAFILDTMTNNKGQFTFTHFPYFMKDSISMVIRALNKKGKAFNVGVELTEPSFPSVESLSADNVRQDDILFDTAARQTINKQKELAAQLQRDDNYLKEVIVKSKLRIPGSKNLNEDGGADETITETALSKTPKVSLLEVLQNQVKGFHIGQLPRSTPLYYMVNANIARFIIDGVDLHFFYQPPSGTGAPPLLNNDYIMFLQGYLRYFSAEDIAGIEIMNYPRYNSTYRSSYLSIEERMNSGPATRDFSFIEITTKTGSGPFFKRVPGMYLYKPLAPVLGKLFYSPRYTSRDSVPLIADLRSTIYWNPEIITDTSGEATVSFYTSESNNNYLILLQGMDLNGGLGFITQTLFVDDKKKN